MYISSLPLREDIITSDDSEATMRKVWSRLRIREDLVDTIFSRFCVGK